MTSLQCPRDRSVLASKDLPGLHVDFCPACHGFAVEIRQAEALARRAPRMPGWPGASAPPALRHHDAAESSLSCPCGAPVRMWRLRAGDARIDFCATCRRLWLDPGEAAVLERFLEGSYGIRALKEDDSIGAASRRASGAARNAAEMDGDAILHVIAGLLEALIYLP